MPIENLFTIGKTVVFQTIFTGISYLAGYFKFNPLWLIFVVAVLMLKYWQDQQRVTIPSKSKSKERLAYSNTLPTWMQFPDVEQCEWVNTIVSQMWPFVDQYIIQVFKLEIEPIVNKYLAAYVEDSFRFSISSLGSVPPRVTGIKVYKKLINRKEIVIDLHIFYAGDCAFSCVFVGLSSGIENVQLRGLVRIVMSPLLPHLPLIGGLDISFLNEPNLEFNLVGLANFLDIPGISGKLHKLINEQISSRLVYPNKIHIELNADKVSLNLTFSEIEGVLQVNVIEARNLKNTDIGFNKKGRSDPYLKVSVGEYTFVSPVIQNTINPKWEFLSEFIIESLYNAILKVEVMDKDKITKNNSLGNITVDINLAKRKGNLDTWIQLEETERGMVHLELSFLTLSSNRNNYKSFKSSQPFYLSSCVLSIFVDSVQNLANTNISKPPSSFIQLSVGNTIKTSKTVTSQSPVYEETFSFLVNNPELDKLHLKLVNESSRANLGHVSICLKDLFNSKGMEILNKPYLLDLSESTVILSLRIRVLKRKKSREMSKADG